jgi:dihydrofolate reductase
VPSRTQYFVAATVDGFIATPEGDLDWLTSIEGGADDTYKRFLPTVGALAMGASTYEWMLANVKEWPYPDLPTWVFTHRELRAFESADLRFVSGTPAEHIEDLRSAAGERNLWMVGGGELASQFAKAELLDDLLLTVAPVVLGEGIRLFARGLPGRVRLVGTREFASGMVELRYELGQPGADGRGSPTQ